MILRALTTLVSLQLAASVILLDAPTPLAPENAVSSEVIVLNVGVDENGRPQSGQVALGAASFTAPAMSAVRAWKFRNEAREPDRVSVTFLFRARTIFPDQTRQLKELADLRTGGDTPPLPILVIDPGFPPTSIAEGFVILQAAIDATGTPTDIRVVRSVPSLDLGTIHTVRDWRFRPARRAGRAVPGTAIIAVSFLRPVVVG